MQARLDAGLTQKQIADALGANQTFVSKYELGERQLTVTQFIRVCQVLHIAPGSLVSDVAHLVPLKSGARRKKPPGQGHPSP